MEGPLKNLDQWDDDVKRRYDPNRKRDEFRQYTDETPVGVQEFYRLNHTYQTRDFVLQKKKEFGKLNRRTMSVWEAMEYLDTLVDESDPDTDLSQIQHLLQTGEAIRKAGHPEWFIVAGVIHDLGKILCLFGEPQWCVVGDTFPVGCAWSEKIVYHKYFAANPDAQIPEYQTRLGIYEEGGGMDKVDLSWGHDEYLFYVVRDYLPEEALYMIRYHSFYPGHKERAYDFLMNDHDKEMFAWVRKFNPFDLYSKSAEPPAIQVLRPYYEELFAKYFPPTLRW